MVPAWFGQLCQRARLPFQPRGVLGNLIAMLRQRQDFSGCSAAATVCWRTVCLLFKLMSNSLRSVDATERINAPAVDLSSTAKSYRCGMLSGARPPQLCAAGWLMCIKPVRRLACTAMPLDPGFSQEPERVIEGFHPSEGRVAANSATEQVASAHVISIWMLRVAGHGGYKQD